MILPDLVKAVEKLNEKTDALLKILSPFEQNIQYTAFNARYDRDFIQALVRKTTHYETSTLLEEAKIKHADGFSALAKKKGSTHPNVIAMDEARQAVHRMGTTAQIRHEVKAQVMAEIGDMVVRFVAQTKADMARKVSEAHGALNKATKVSEDAVAKVEEMKLAISEGIDKLMTDRVSALNEEHRELIVGFKKDSIRMVEGAKASLESITNIKQEVDKRVKEVGNLGSLLEGKIQEAASEAQFNLEKHSAALLERVDAAVSKTDREVKDFLSASASQTRKAVENAEERVAKAISDTGGSVTDSVKELEKRQKVLESLASSVQDTIMKTEQSIATVGNTIPKSHRNRIRITHV